MNVIMGRWSIASQVAAICAALCCGTAAQAQTQSAAAPTISVASIILVEPMVETPIPIRVAPGGALPRNSFVRIRGLPPQSVLSDGHFVSAGTWALPLASLGELKLTVPLATTGRAELQIALMSIEGAALAEARTTIAVTAATIGTVAAPQTPPPTSQLPSSAALGNDAVNPPALIKPPAPAAQRPPPPAPATVAVPNQTMLPEQRERALKLLHRGDQEFSGGDVATARLLYQRAADAGLGDAALALGMTYDPAELSRRGVKGMRGEPEQARKWYGKAQELGAIGAAERLSNLPR